MQKLTFAKYLDVKSPVSASKGEAGIDLFVPTFDKETISIIQDKSIIHEADQRLWFIDTTTKSDIRLSIGKFMACMDIDCDDSDLINTRLSSYLYKRFPNGFIPAGHHFVTNYKQFVIPSGIAIDYPKGYYGAVQNRSSNFGNGVLVQDDTCDNTFTQNGTYIQVYNLSGGYVHIMSGDRIAQLILKEYTETELTEISHNEFQLLDTVLHKRLLRSGGFGSTGK